MGDAGFLPAPKRTLASPEHEELLNIIDQIRSQGISRYIDLPQIIVCGDQSSGKSSCLEAICGLRFPTGDGLCTRFATEYILRRSSEESVSISILPDTERNDTDKVRVQRFKPSTEDLSFFPNIIDEAALCMGIGETGRTFSHDVLRIEISGPDQENLTLVDLPGLFHSSSKSHSDDDKDAVFSLVGSYISRSRSIILAVVSAKNDLNNQAVLNFAKKHDEKGTRTLGIITKPDTLSRNSPSEQAYLDLARNSDVKFALDWHVLRNRSWEEKDRTATQRDQTEERFSSRGSWEALDIKNKGIHFLRIRLGKILFDHILSELPSLLRDVETGLAGCRARLATLGASRSTLDEQKLYLLRVSQKFVALMTAAVDGTYSDSFFGSSIPKEGFQKRLRAVAISTLKQFSADMRSKGHAIMLVDTLSAKYVHTDGHPLKMKYNDYYQQVQLRMQRNGGRELPGLFNPSIVGDLFFDQAKPWQRLVDSAKDALLEAANTSVDLVLQHAADESTIHAILRVIINPGMETLEQSLSAKAEEVLRPNVRGHPFTLNHYFTENIQKKRADQNRENMADRLYEFFGVNADCENAEDRRYEGSFDMRRLLDILVKRSELDMDRFAAIECTNAMLSYYKVAFKTLIDAFGMYAVEECLLSKLPGIFTPEIVLGLDNATVQRIAGESESSLLERENLKKKLSVLEKTQKILHRLDRHKPKGTSSRSHLSGLGTDDHQMSVSTHKQRLVSTDFQEKRSSSEGGSVDSTAVVGRPAEVAETTSKTSSTSAHANYSMSTSTSRGPVLESPGAKKLYRARHFPFSFTQMAPPATMSVRPLPNVDATTAWRQPSPAWSHLEEKHRLVMELPDNIVLVDGTRMRLENYMRIQIATALSLSGFPDYGGATIGWLKTILIHLFFYENLPLCLEALSKWIDEAGSAVRFAIPEFKKLLKSRRFVGLTLQTLFGMKKSKLADEFERRVGVAIDLDE